MCKQESTDPQGFFQVDLVGQGIRTSDRVLGPQTGYYDLREGISRMVECFFL